MIDQFVDELFKRFNEGGIQYAILRNYENLPRQPSDTNYFDLDFLIAKSDLAKYLKLLIELAEEYKLFVVKKIDREYVKTIRIAHIDACGNVQSVQLDSHISGQNWWGFFYLTEDQIFKNKNKFKSYTVVSNFHQNLFNWLDKLFFGNYIKQKYKSDILKSFSIHKSELYLFLNSVFGKRLSMDLISIINTENLEETLKYRKSMIAKLRKYSIIQFPLLTLISNIKFYYFEILLYLFPPGLCCIFNKSDRPIIDSYFSQCKKVYLGDQLIIKFSSFSRISWLKFYLNQIFPIVRKGGMVFVEVSDNFLLFKNKKKPIHNSISNSMMEIIKAGQLRTIFGQVNISFFRDHS